MKFEITGTPFPVVECRLERGEEMITEGGSMVWMSNDMEMHTTGTGGLGRLFSGENIFRNIYTAGSDDSYIAFGASFPGRIIPLDLRNGAWIFQKGSFLASESSVNLSTFFNKKLSTGLFGGEGFIMQQYSGNGTVFIEIGGGTQEFVLEAGQQKIIDTGYLVCMDDTCSLDIKTVGSVTNALFGGEGIFNTVITGPGRIILQTMPENTLTMKIANKVLSMLPKQS